MADSILQINKHASSYTKVSEGNTAIVSCVVNEIIYPTKHIAGKNCLVQATFCNMITDKPLLDTLRNDVCIHFDISFNSIWSQVYNRTNFPQLQPAIGVKELGRNNFYSLGPRIVRIPDGPTSISIRCFTPNNVAMTAADSTAPLLTIVLHIVPVE
jgi:hypothetical protein